MARITDLLASGPSLSIELWPPRSDAAALRLEDALRDLEVLRPTFTSITYGAGGSTRDRTHELVIDLAQRGKTEPMAHLTCAAHRRDELVQVLERYAADGIENVLALRGDPPLDSAGPLPDGELAHAIDLVKLARSIGPFCIAVAAHPEGHPDTPDPATERRYLAEKLELADFAITQFFFRPESYASLVEDLTRSGNTKPVLPGIMPITNVRTVTRMAELSGTSVPRDVVERIEAAPPADVAKIGVEIATELCAELIAMNVPGLHFYTMNQVRATLEVCNNLGLL